MPFTLHHLWHAATRHQSRARQTAPPAGHTLWTKNFIIISVVNLLFCICGNMLITAFPFYLVQLGGDEVTVGVAASLYAATSMLTRPIAGWLLDERSRRQVFIVGLTGAILIPPLYLLIPMIGAMLCMRAIHGAAWSAVSSSCSTNACDTIPQSKFGSGMGIFGLTNSLAMVIGPALGLTLWDKVGAAPLFLLITCLSLISFLLIRKFDFLEITRHSSARRLPLFQRVYHLFDKRALPAAALMSLMALPAGAISSFMALYAAASGVANGGVFFTFQALGAGVVRIISGRMCDKHGEGPSLYISYGCFTTGLLLAIFAKTAFPFYLGAFIFGLGYGLGVPALQTMCYRTVPPERRGAASSTYLCSWDIFSGLGGLLGGLLVDRFSYTFMFCSLLICNLFGVLLYRLWASKTESAFYVHKLRQAALQEKTDQNNL